MTGSNQVLVTTKTKSRQISWRNFTQVFQDRCWSHYTEDSSLITKFLVMTSMMFWHLLAIIIWQQKSNLCHHCFIDKWGYLSFCIAYIFRLWGTIKMTNKSELWNSKWIILWPQWPHKWHTILKIASNQSKSSKYWWEVWMLGIGLKKQNTLSSEEWQVVL